MRKSKIIKDIEPFALTHATAIVGDEAGTVIGDATILVNRQGLIEHIGPSADAVIPDGYHTLDATGKTVMPGLINIHTHLFSDGKPLNPKLATPKGQRMVAAFAHSPAGRPYIDAKAKSSVMTLLNSGVTTIRTLGDVGYEAVFLRNRVDGGDLVAPRIFASGPLLAIPEGHGAPLIALTSSTADEARANTETNIANGVNAIKIAATGGVTDSQVLGEAGAPQMTVEQMRAICDAAHAEGIIVAAHAQSPEGVKRALEAGVDTIEHGSALDDDMLELMRSNPNSLNGWSSITPTLSAGLPMERIDQETLGLTDIQMENSHTVVQGMVQGAIDAHKAGIRVGVGTDSAMTFVPQYATWREIDLLVKVAGFTPAEALRAACAVNADILGLGDTIGTLETNKVADLVVYNANPLEDIATMEQPALVVAAGHPVFRPNVKRFDDMDAILAKAYAA